MAGYREFQTGEVLTAANVNSFLMEQATMTFADAAARDAALAEVLRAGLNVYLEDTDRLQYYDGTDWQNVPNESDVDAAGGLVAVKHVLKTDTFSASVGSGEDEPVTGLAITHALQDPSNRLIITASVHVGESGQRNQVGIAVSDGTSLLAIGDADGGRTRVSQGGGTTGSALVAAAQNLAFTFIHEPNDTTERTYTVHVICVQSARTLFVNRSAGDADTASNPRGASTLVIQEIKV